MTPTASFLTTTATTLLASLAFVLSGLWFISKFTFERGKSASFQIAAAFFIGGSLFLGLFRTFSQFAEGLHIPLGMASGVVLIFATAMIPRLKETFAGSHCSRRFAFCSLVVAILVETCILTYWLTPPWVPRDAPFEFVGTLHSGRYVGLAEYIVKSGHIPVLGQNYGQALLTTISLLAGANSPYLALHLWLVTHVCALLLLVFGFFRMAQYRTSVAIAAVCLTALGGSALSVSNFIVIDSGNPWLLSGYSDSVSGLSTFFIFVVLCLNKENRNRWFLFWASVILAVFTLRWGMSSAQNIILMLVLFASACALRVFAKKGWALRDIVIFGVVLCVFTALVRRQGGMLTPLALQDEVKLVGMLNVERDSAEGKKVKVVPYLKHFLVSGADEALSVESPLKESVQRFQRHLERKWIDAEAWPAIVVMGEEYLVSALRALFWPIAGTIAAFVLGVRAQRRGGIKRAVMAHNRGAQDTSVLEGLPPYLFSLSLVNAVVLSAGFAACYLFEVNGYKWELTRFMIPGYGIGMLLVIGSGAHLIKEHADASRAKSWMAALIGVVCLGPAIFITYTCIRNIFSDIGGFTFARRAARMITLSGTGVSKGEYSAIIQSMLNNALQIAGQRTSFGGTFTPFALVLRDVSLSVEESNITLDASEQFESLFQKLEAIKLKSPFKAVALVNMVCGTESDPQDCSFWVTVEHVDADPAIYKFPFKRHGKNLEIGNFSKTEAAQRLIPWQ
jgi:hypothetical protein